MYRHRTGTVRSTGTGGVERQQVTFRATFWIVRSYVLCTVVPQLVGEITVVQISGLLRTPPQSTVHHVQQTSVRVVLDNLKLILL